MKDSRWCNGTATPRGSPSPTERGCCSVPKSAARGAIFNSRSISSFLTCRSILNCSNNASAGLDRIGQTADIQIHVPYLARSPQEVLARWYHEGLNAFENNLEGGNELLRQFGRAVHDLALEFPVADRAAAEQELAGLLKKTKRRAAGNPPAS